MKKSELVRIIKEEVKNVLKEQTPIKKCKRSRYITSDEEMLIKVKSLSKQGEKFRWSASYGGKKVIETSEYSYGPELDEAAARELFCEKFGKEQTKVCEFQCLDNLPNAD